MPAERIRDEPVAVQRFDVAGLDSSAAPEFISHVALAGEERDDLTRDFSEVRLTHMQPPLKRESRPTPVDVIASAGLSPSQQSQVNIFLDEVANEYEAERARGTEQYVVNPHMAEPDADYSCRRFSCAGLVIEAYRYARIRFLVTAENRLPTVDLATLRMAYPGLANRLDDPEQRVWLGLDRDTTEWRVVLAGYVVNALNRPNEEVRSRAYAPVAGDAYFPSRVTETND